MGVGVTGHGAERGEGSRRTVDVPDAQRPTSEEVPPRPVRDVVTETTQDPDIEMCGEGSRR